MKNHPTVVALILAALFVTSCATFQGGNPTDLVNARVAAFWQAKIDGRWDVAYGFHCKDFKAVVSQSNFIKSANVETVGFSVSEVVFQDGGTTAMVTVLGDIAFQGMPLVAVPIKEKWLQEDDNWYLCPESRGFLDLFKKK